jgi:integrase
MGNGIASRSRRRANREGSIYFVESEGRWRAAVTWTDAEGRQRRKQISGRTQADVRKRLAALRTDLDRGLAPAAETTVAGFLTAWLASSRQRIRPATHRQYESVVRVHIAPALGRLTLSKMTPANVERMTAGMLESGSAPRTAALARVVLRRALADAQRDGIVHRNVAALARPPRVPSRSLVAGRDYLDAVDLRRLVTAGKVHPLGPLVTLAASTGLRQGELLGLAWTDVDLEEATLTVRRSLAHAWEGGYALAEPKTARSRRTLNLPSIAVDALRRQRELQEAATAAVGTAWQDRDGLVFTDAVGRPLMPYDVSHAFGRLLLAARIPRIPFHGLRHSAATAMLAAGVPLKVVSDALGHSTITITADRYSGVVPAQRREAAEAIDRALASVR